VRLVTKGREPQSLRAYRALPGARYDGGDFTAVKDDVRTTLLREQAHLCCYCTRRISAEVHANPASPDAPGVPQMKVEHWRPQSRFPELALAWGNLLGACTGGIGVAPSDQTCDTRKGERLITLDPQNAAHIATLRCRLNGRLRSSDAQLQEDIDDHLGLNHPVLVEDRRAVIERALARLGARYPRRAFPPGALRDAIASEEAVKDGRAPALCAALRLWAQGRFG